MVNLRWFTLRLVPVAFGAVAALFVACGDENTSAPSSGTNETSLIRTSEAQATLSKDDRGRIAEIGDSVEVHYRGTLENGDVFDSSLNRDPLQFVIGSGQMIAGFDNAVRGMSVGDTVMARLEPAEAYGEVDPALIDEFPISQAPEGIKVGDQVSVSGIPAVVTIVSDSTVTVDANHQLAGEILTFEIQMMVIK